MAATWSRYPNSQLVVVAGAAGPAHIPGPSYQDDPAHVPTVSEFDQQFLHSYAVAW